VPATAGTDGTDGIPIGRHYIALERIGSGSMGTVYRARSRDDGRDLAVKVLRRELAEDPQFVARFVQERTILMHLGGPGVVEVVDLVVDRDTLAIVMERVQGGSLRQYLHAQGGRLGVEVAIEIVVQVLDGLARAHAQGVLHRDVKPENILVDGRTWPPSVKVSDFGISGLADGSSITRLTGFVGTPSYMAPELSSPDPVSPAVDVYATGIILYELLSGTTPFAGGHPIATMRRHLEELPARPPGISGELWIVLSGMLAKVPAHRPDALVAAAQLRQVLTIDAPGDPPLSSSHPDETLDPGWVSGAPGPSGATPLVVAPGPVDPSAVPTAAGTPVNSSHTAHRTSSLGGSPPAYKAPAAIADEWHAQPGETPLLPTPDRSGGVDETSATYIRGDRPPNPQAAEPEAGHPREPRRRILVGAVAVVVILALAGAGFALKEGMSTLRWSSPLTVAPGNVLYGVSCSSPSFCAAVGDKVSGNKFVGGGTVVTYNGHRWSSPLTVAPGNVLYGVSCSSPSSCVAVGAEDTGNKTIAGTVVTYNGHHWSSPQTVASGAVLGSVSCSSPSFCAAVGGKVSGNTFSTGTVVTYNGHHWSSPQTVASGAFLDGVSCSSPSSCVAVGYEHYEDMGNTSNTGTVLTYNGHHWSSPQTVAPGAVLGSVSCSSPSFCAAVGFKVSGNIESTGTVVTYNGHHWSSPQTVASGAVLHRVSCSFPSSCVAVGAEDTGNKSFAGTVVTYNGNRWSSPQTVAPGALFGVSCSSPSSCVAVGAKGQALYYR